MKSLYVEDIRRLSENARMPSVVLALAAWEKKTDKKGAPYLSLTLSDRTGSIMGNKFQCDSLPQGCKIGGAVEVDGTFSSRWNSITIQNISEYTKPIDPGDFLASCPKDKDVGSMNLELSKIISSLRDANLKKLLFGIFLSDEEVKAKLERWPAAQERHHAYIGGLLVHTLAVAKLAQQSAEFYEVNRDLLVAGALLHDIGKLQEFDFGLIAVYTDMGNLLGHSLLGSILVRDRILAINGFPERLRDELLHIIVSHHGEREWGAITKPMTLEAFLVFSFDYTDSRADRYQRLIHEQRPLEQNISPWDQTLETRVYAPKLEDGH